MTSQSKWPQEPRSGCAHALAELPSIRFMAAIHSAVAMMRAAPALCRSRSRAARSHQRCRRWAALNGQVHRSAGHPQPLSPFGHVAFTYTKYVGPLIHRQSACLQAHTLYCAGALERCTGHNIARVRGPPRTLYARVRVRGVKYLRARLSSAPQLPSWLALSVPHLKHKAELPSCNRAHQHAVQDLVIFF